MSQDITIGGGSRGGSLPSSGGGSGILSNLGSFSSRSLAGGSYVSQVGGRGGGGASRVSASFIDRFAAETALEEAEASGGRLTIDETQVAQLADTQWTMSQQAYNPTRCAAAMQLLWLGSGEIVPHVHLQQCTNLPDGGSGELCAEHKSTDIIFGFWASTPRTYPPYRGPDGIVTEPNPTKVERARATAIYSNATRVRNEAQAQRALVLIEQLLGRLEAARAREVDLRNERNQLLDSKAAAETAVATLTGDTATLRLQRDEREQRLLEEWEQRVADLQTLLRDQERDLENNAEQIALYERQLREARREIAQVNAERKDSDDALKFLNAVVISPAFPRGALELQDEKVATALTADVASGLPVTTVATTTSTTTTLPAVVVPPASRTASVATVRPVSSTTVPSRVSATVAAPQPSRVSFAPQPVLVRAATTVPVQTSQQVLVPTQAVAIRPASVQTIPAVTVPAVSNAPPRRAASFVQQVQPAGAGNVVVQTRPLTIGGVPLSTAPLRVIPAARTGYTAVHTVHPATYAHPGYVHAHPGFVHVHPAYNFY